MTQQTQLFVIVGTPFAAVMVLVLIGELVRSISGRIRDHRHRTQLRNASIAELAQRAERILQEPDYRADYINLREQLAALPSDDGVALQRALSESYEREYLAALARNGGRFRTADLSWYESGLADIADELKSRFGRRKM